MTTQLPPALHFHGPFTFVDRGRGIPSSGYAQSEGVYLWVLTDGRRRFIHYVGETSVLLKRLKQHLTNILGLKYGIFRADAVAADDPQPIFGGMWRDMSDNSINATVASWLSLQRQTHAYLESIEVFFAPTSLPEELRKHVEGRIARQLTERHPAAARFYPADNWTRTMPAPLGGRIRVTADQPIEGLDAELDV